MVEEARQMLRQKCKTSLRFLCKYVLYKRDDGTYGMDIGKLQKDMIRKWVRKRRRRFSLWLIPRSHLKTWVWTVAGTIQEHLNNPNLRVLIINATFTKASDILKEIKQQWEQNDLLRWLFPEYCPDLAPRGSYSRGKWTDERIDYPCGNRAGAREGNIECMGVMASLVSKHFDLMIFDDPVNDINSTTVEFRNKVHTWYKNALQLRHSPRTSRVRLIGTFWNYDDVYSRIKKREAQKVKEGKAPLYYIYHRKVVENDKLIWPERFTFGILDELKAELGSYIFNCQYMLEPVAPDEAMFKLEQINYLAAADLPHDLAYYAAVDLAEEEGEDHTVITVAGVDPDHNYYVRYIFRAKLSPLNLVYQLSTICKVFNVQRIAIETVSFQNSIYKFYRRWAAENNEYIPWQEMKRGKSQKFWRIQALQPVLENGNFHCVQEIENVEFMEEELTQYPRGHDDILDTLADIVKISRAATVENVPDYYPDNAFNRYHEPLWESGEDEEEYLEPVMGSEWRELY